MIFEGVDHKISPRISAAHLAKIVKGCIAVCGNGIDSNVGPL